MFQLVRPNTVAALVLLLTVLGCEAGPAKSPATTPDTNSDTELTDTLAVDVNHPPDVPLDLLVDEFPSTPQDVLTSCPAESPTSGPYPVPCQGNFKCTYGEECCCQACKPSLECTCYGDQMQCSYTDACWMVHTKCSPGCGFGEFEGPEGCQNCFAGKNALAAQMDAVLAPLNTCVTHTDCAAIKPPNECNFGCTLGIPVSQTQTALDGLKDVFEGWCPVIGACGMPCPPFETPACVEGKCQIVGPCDTDVEPIGTACDDGDPCTQNDVCIAQNHCKGNVTDCNDNNPCTDDFCLDGSGCKNQPIAAVCANQVACSLGGICQAGQCVDSGATGLKVNLPGPAALAQESDLVATKDGSYLLTYTVQGGNQARLLKLSDTGAVVWDVSALGPGTRAFSVGQTADGGVAVAGTAKKPDAGLLATVWYLDDKGASQKAIDLGVPNPIHARLAPRPEGGVAVLVTSQPQDNVYSATLVLVGADGAVGTKVELGNMAPDGTANRIAARSGSIAVVLSANKSTGGQEPDTEVRFVRMDGTGKVVANVAVSVTGGANWPAGLVAVGTSWVASIGNITYGKDGKTTGHTLLQLSDAGDTVWSKATKGGPLLATATGLLTLGWYTDAAVGLQAVWTTYDNQGSQTATWSVPTLVAGGMSSGTLLGIAAASNGGAVAVHSTAFPQALTWFRFDGAGGCL